jgi:4-methyl-5(b-hydroxyethyl)-thiazole monophosphate biosynthesis
MVYVLLADGFEETEAIEPIDIMRRSGIDVLTASIMPSKTVEGSHGIKVEADIMINEVNTEDMELIMLPGGGKGHELLDASNDVHALLNQALIKGAYIAAICAAPSILGKKQMLSGKTATCYPGFEKYLYGAKYTTDRVVKDGKFITSRGAGTASDFGFEIVSVLKDKKTADEIRGQMQY